MNDAALQIYHAMPSAVRTAVAGLRGFYLRAWRYDGRTEALVEEALERERWTEDRWAEWQRENLAVLLRRAVLCVPYYREHWHRRRMKGDRASWERLENWDLLEKNAVRENPAAFLAEDCHPWRMYVEHTSGTTGTPLTLWRSRTTDRMWYALFEARSRRWHGVSRQDRWAILGGQRIVPVSRNRPPFWVWNAGLRQLYLSAYHLSPALITDYLDALRRYRVEYLLGYPSALYSLARGALEGKRRDLRMKVALANAEPVLSHQRAAIEEAFECPLRETYGLAEIVAAAGECEQGQLHLWPEVGIVEIVQGGELVATGLLNRDMPLIRYRTGDRATIAPAVPACGCGRTLPRLARLEGRVDDVICTRDGRRIGRLDPLFKAALPIREAQIVQETLDRVRIRYVPAVGFTPRDAGSLAERLRSFAGPMETVLEEVDRIPRDAAGKFRAVVSKLPSGEAPR